MKGVSDREQTDGVFIPEIPTKPVEAVNVPCGPGTNKGVRYFVTVP